MNAGAVITDLNAGNITAQEIIDISPFSNDLEVLVVTGQDILDALEFGVKELPNPTPRFPQVSGMSYKVDKS
ncbi:MAG: 5'-nucleotidase, partial [Bacteroidales bacterium]|nr:5'-nucleotidase [Bacteroidales bacterium]